MRARVQKWGNSLAVRLPKPLASEIKIVEGSEVELQLSGSDVVMTPVRPQFTLDGLLKDLKKSQLHHEQKWGPAVGKEAW